MSHLFKQSKLSINIFWRQLGTPTPAYRTVPLSILFWTQVRMFILHFQMVGRVFCSVGEVYEIRISVCVNTVRWDTARSIRRLLIICGCFHGSALRLRSFSKDRLAREAENVYYQALYGRSFSTPDIESYTWIEKSQKKAKKMGLNLLKIFCELLTFRQKLACALKRCLHV